MHYTPISEWAGNCRLTGIKQVRSLPLLLRFIVAVRDPAVIKHVHSHETESGGGPERFGYLC